jgi:hypothetical protein
MDLTKSKIDNDPIRLTINPSTNNTIATPYIFELLVNFPRFMRMTFAFNFSAVPGGLAIVHQAQPKLTIQFVRNPIDPSKCRVIPLDPQHPNNHPSNQHLDPVDLFVTLGNSMSKTTHASR